MLYVYAEADENVPTADSVAYLQALPATEGRNIEIRVLPGLEHTMFSAGGVRLRVADRCGVPRHDRTVGGRRGQGFPASGVKE